MSGIIYTSISNEQVYNKLYCKSQLGAYTSYIRGKRCETEKEFFQEISASFQFPWYFGENWAAFDECICDLEWLKFKSIFVIVDDFNKIFKGDIELQKLLIKYFSDTIDYWESENISFEILLNN